MIDYLCFISVLLLSIHPSVYGGGAGASTSQIIHCHQRSKKQDTHHMHTMMTVRRLPTTLAFQGLAANTYIGKQLQRCSCTDAASHLTIRKRRRRYNAFRAMMSMDDGSDAAATKVTQYTINDSICPPTDPDNLEKIVQKHIHTLPRYWFSKPVAKHTEAAFQEALDFVKQYGEKKKIPNADKLMCILDSGCGTGRSTFILGQMHPNCVVIGIDQSIARLSRNKSYNQTDLLDDDDQDESNNQKRRNDRNNNFSNVTLSNHQDDQSQSNNQNDNVLLLRAELSDFWKCCLSSNQWQEKICIYKHYLLYPNPYPKKSRLKSRFYAHPAFPLLMMTVQMDGGLPTEEEKEKLVVRSNWKGYLNEFKSAVGTWDDCGGSFVHWKKTFLDVDHTVSEDWHPNNEESCMKFESSGPYRLDGNVKEEAMTNFEAKYIEVGEAIYELSVKVRPHQT